MLPEGAGYHLLTRLLTASRGALSMPPIEAFVARANIARMRLQIAAEPDCATKAAFERLLEAQIEILQVGEAEDASASPQGSEER